MADLLSEAADFTEQESIPIPAVKGDPDLLSDAANVA